MMIVWNGDKGNRYKCANLEIETNCRKVNGKVKIPELVLRIITKISTRSINNKEY